MCVDVSFCAELQIINKRQPYWLWLTNRHNAVLQKLVLDIQQQDWQFGVLLQGKQRVQNRKRNVL
jgi:hypothetical protein